MSKAASDQGVSSLLKIIWNVITLFFGGVGLALWNRIGPFWTPALFAVIIAFSYGLYRFYAWYVMITKEIPLIKITKVPPLEEQQPLEGRACVKDVRRYRVAVVIKWKGNWFSKPNINTPLTNIQKDGSWSCCITPNWEDLEATQAKAFLLPVSGIKDMSLKVLNESSIPLHIEKEAVDSHEVELIPAPPEKVAELKAQKKK